MWKCVGLAVSVSTDFATFHELLSSVICLSESQAKAD